MDADAADAVTEENMEKTIALARDFSGRTGAVIAISGAVDIVTDTKNTYIIRNGHPVMAKITGCGCMLSSLTAAYLAANPDRKLEPWLLLSSPWACAGRRHMRKWQRRTAATQAAGIT